MNDWLEIGTIVAPQGLKGELRVNANSDFPERFKEPGKRWLQSPDRSTIREIELLGGRYIPGKNIYVIRLAGVTHINEAEELRGHKLLVPKSDRPQLAEDEYHVSDLIDLAVYNQLTGEKIGVISDIFSAGNDLLEVKLDRQPTKEVLEDILEVADSNVDKLEEIRESPIVARRGLSDKKRQKKPKSQSIATVLIPFVKEIVPIVDLERKLIEILPPPGLLEVND